MKRSVRTSVVTLMMQVLTGAPEITMEAAKELIGLYEYVEPALLIWVLDNRLYKTWSRVAAAYVLGFLEPDAAQEAIIVLRRVLLDRGEPVRLRSHVAEALGNLVDIEAVPVLSSILLNVEESRRLQRWCIYALSEIRSTEAVHTLERFSATNPAGILAQEVNTALTSHK